MTLCTGVLCRVHVSLIVYSQKRITLLHEQICKSHQSITSTTHVLLLSCCSINIYLKLFDIDQFKTLYRVDITVIEVAPFLLKMVFNIKLKRLEKVPWGFRLTGGVDLKKPLTITKVKTTLQTYCIYSNSF